MASLAECIDAPVDPEEEARAAFIAEIESETGIDLDVKLDTLLERMREREEQIERTNEIAQRRIDMIEGWRHQQNESAKREFRWLRSHFEAIAKGYDFGNKKSRALPCGTFGYRKKADTIEIVDMEAAVAFAEANGLEIKKSVNKTPLMSHLKACGEVPAGCELIPGGDEFYVRTS